MILIDSSIWIDHVRRADPVLTRLLEERTVLGHSWVAGELALGRGSRRDELISLVLTLPRAVLAADSELLRFIELESLSATGIGYVDAQLLASTRLTPDARLWSRDNRLASVAARLGVGFDPADER